MAGKRSSKQSSKQQQPKEATGAQKKESSGGRTRSKIKQPTKSTKGAAQKTGGLPPTTAVMERLMAQLHELLEEQDFESIEEAKAFIDTLLSTGDLAGPPGMLALPGLPRQRAVDRAQEIMYDAWEAPTARESVRLAKQALKISPDCADAYVLLAEETAQTALAAKALYEQGVAAGERALGPSSFTDDVGYFWGILETRPYMRARAGLATALWKLGEHRAAMEHARDMLRLNPGDNQGIRYMLLEWLLAEQQRGNEVEREAVAKLLAEYEEDASAAWLYGRALHLFMQGDVAEGITDAATEALRVAIEQNPHVPAYLLGTKKLPRRLPDYVGWGDDAEAVVYAEAAMPRWLAAPGAMDWLNETVSRLNTRHESWS